MVESEVMWLQHVELGESVLELDITYLTRELMSLLKNKSVSINIGRIKSGRAIGSSNRRTRCRLGLVVMARFGEAYFGPMTT